MTSFHNHEKKYEKTKQTKQIKEQKLFKKDIITSHPIIISTIIKRIKIIYILINTNCLIYKTISSMFIRKAGLKHINISTRKLIGIGEKKDHINKIIKIKIDIDKHKQNIYFYII